MNILRRPRRNRRSEALRDLIAETTLTLDSLVYPVFICSGSRVSDPIATMPGQDRMSVDVLCERMKSWKSLGLRHFALFPQIEEGLKDPRGREALNDNGLLPQALKQIKDAHPEAHLISDVALDPYSSHGHDGVLENGRILNDVSVEILAEMAVRQAQWGADTVAPSDMMDGRVGAIREALDSAGFTDTGLIAYSAKYASSFYGPFRDALNSAPKEGNKKTYQMDFRNSKEALLEVQLDIEQGADMVMIKPGLCYLDIISKVKASCQIPVAAYNVSGEYAMVKAACQMGALDEKSVVLEILTSFRRAGADAIFTYHAVEAARSLQG